MVSESVRELRKPARLSSLALGRFKLKNVGRPVELFAVIADGIVAPEAALEGKGERFASLPTNLPAAAPLLGREGTSRTCRARQGHRIVTIRVPVAWARRSSRRARPAARPEFLDGVAFMEFAEVPGPRTCSRRSPRHST